MDKKTLTLSSALVDLENIAQSLEHTDLDVQSGLLEFKKGVELIEFCKAELKKAENQFTELKARLDKDIEETF